jgi:hypothetical protein
MFGNAVVPVSFSLVVDLDDQSTVTTMYDVFPITDSTENRIVFRGEGKFGAGVSGSLDRISGTASMVVTTRAEDDLIDLKCKPATPLF